MHRILPSVFRSCQSSRRDLRDSVPRRPQRAQRAAPSWHVLGRSLRQGMQGRLGSSAQFGCCLIDQIVTFQIVGATAECGRALVQEKLKAVSRMPAKGSTLDGLECPQKMHFGNLGLHLRPALPSMPWARRKEHRSRSRYEPAWHSLMDCGVSILYSRPRC